MTVNWIPINPDDPSTFPEVKPDGDFTDYILLSFDNFSLIEVGHYRADDNGDGAFYCGDDAKSCASYGLIVNAWMPIIPPYRGE